MDPSMHSTESKHAHGTSLENGRRGMRILHILTWIGPYHVKSSSCFSRSPCFRILITRRTSCVLVLPRPDGHIDFRSLFNLFFRYCISWDICTARDLFLFFFFDEKKTTSRACTQLTCNHFNSGNFFPHESAPLCHHACCHGIIHFHCVHTFFFCRTTANRIHPIYCFQRCYVLA